MREAHEQAVSSLNGHEERQTYGPQLIELLQELADIGRDDTGGVTRLLYTRSWLSAQQKLMTWMKEAGLEVFFDRAGNLTGRLQGTDPDLAPIVTGSHVDTVTSGGDYDGALGIVAGLLALIELKEQYGKPTRTLEVVALCEEEGSRFPTAYWGSGSIAGRVRWEDVGLLPDREGISMLEAARECGFGPDSSYAEPARKLGAYLELHIEQGSVLERSNIPIGIVSAIVAQQRYRIQLHGEANHAGTTPMGHRKDALTCAARMIVAAQSYALEADDGLVATVGSISVTPGTPNVIPGGAEFTLDIRHAEDAELQRHSRELLRQFSVVAEEDEVSFVSIQTLDAAAVPMGRQLMDSLIAVCHSKQLAFRVMTSGAGHDAQMFRHVCPTAMIFVPSRGGISHSPDEYTSPEHLILGYSVLASALYELGYGGAGA
ncbi:M20 family metallo-hydrolase [Paenibacillus massiliensis]|uniref:M20 family metallo-hydrolase n=1 Tax=Paenibacillus massiliensis TaxID=225917 RepID=UPI000406D25A|nr:M20 family metallo-hydrolase [Paenibacillus massiliensis]